MCGAIGWEGDGGWGLSLLILSPCVAEARLKSRLMTVANLVRNSPPTPAKNIISNIFYDDGF